MIDRFHSVRSITLPLRSVPPASLPIAHPMYAPVTMVMGHFCQSRSLEFVSMLQLHLWLIFGTNQSNGIGTAPIHAPINVPNAPPYTSSIGSRSAIIVLHLSLSTPWTYTSGRTARRERWAAQRNVCGRCVVNGAPKRIARSVRMGVPSKRERVRERIADYRSMSALGIFRLRVG